jgi:replication initiation protein RepC
MEGTMQLASSGGRRLRHAALAARGHALDAGRTVTRKELSTAAREAAEALRLRTTLRVVLSELVANWGEQGWDKILVWPSNDHLMRRTGLSERAIRASIRALVELQLVIPKDSPNGKRYAVKDLAGEIVDAFGFDLTPVYARRGEWTQRIVEQKQLREVQKRAFDEVTICRRAAEEALNALAHHFPEHNRSDLEEKVKALKARTPVRSTHVMPLGILEEWQATRNACEEAFYKAGNDSSSCRHKEYNNESPSGTCNKGFPRKAGDVLPKERPAEHLSPALIVETCPTVTDCGRPIRNIDDLIAAGRYLRASLGAHESAWNEAVADIGPVGAAAAVIYVLQLYDDDVSSGTQRIRNPGGYFRAFVRMVKSGKVNLEVELLAMRRRRMS